MNSGCFLFLTKNGFINKHGDVRPLTPAFPLSKFGKKSLLNVNPEALRQGRIMWSNSKSRDYTFLLKNVIIEQSFLNDNLK